MNSQVMLVVPQKGFTNVLQSLVGAAQQLDMDIFNIITGEPVER